MILWAQSCATSTAASQNPEAVSSRCCLERWSSLFHVKHVGFDLAQTVIKN
jgi:hypothetical protein